MGFGELKSPRRILSGGYAAAKPRHNHQKNGVARDVAPHAPDFDMALGRSRSLDMRLKYGARSGKAYPIFISILPLSAMLEAHMLLRDQPPGAEAEV